jgi:hypothetical protein
MGAELIGDCLDRLSAALTRLDHAAVSQCADELEQLRPQVAPDLLSGASAALLLFQLRHAVALTEKADHLYEGWRRMAAPDGTAYTPEGCEPATTQTPNVKVEG